MANNYTVSSLETPTGIIETPGDNVSASTPIYVLTITPDLGYTVTYSNFVANSLPSEISSVVFTQNGEIVVATINFAASFVMPSADVNLQIDIDGSAQLKNYTIDGTFTTTQENTSTSSVSNVAYSNNGNYTTKELVLTKTFTASTTSGTGFSGYYFNEKPYISGGLDLFNESNGYSVETTDVYTGSLLTAKTFNIYYTYPAENRTGDNIQFTARATNIFTEDPKITGYEIVDSVLSKFGETRKFRVYGAPFVKFNLVITALNADTYDFSTGTFTSSATSESDKVMPSIGYEDYNIIFPGGSGPSGEVISDNVFTLALSAGTNATLTLGGGLPSSVILNQYTDKSISFTVSDSGSTGYTISTMTPISGAVGETDPVIVFNNVFTVAYSSAVNILTQPTVSNIITTGGGRTDIAISDIVLSQGVTNTINVTIPDSYIYEFGANNVTLDFNIASFLSVAANVAPTATAASFTATSNVPRKIMLGGTDPEGATLTFAIVSQPPSGTLSNLNVNTGEVTYTANVSYSGSDSFTFKVNDGALDSTAATISLTVSVASTTYYPFMTKKLGNPTLACAFSGTLDETYYTISGTGPSDGAGTRIYSAPGVIDSVAGSFVYTNFDYANKIFDTTGGSTSSIDSNGIQICLI